MVSSFFIRTLPRFMRPAVKADLPSSHEMLAKTNLKTRLIYIFSVIAIVPAIIMTLLSAFFFHFGVQAWFSERVQTAVNESQAVAQAYLEEHKQVIRADTLAMANDLNRQANIFIMNEEAFESILQTQAILRGLSEALVFDAQGRIYARSGITFSLEFEEIPSYLFERAQEGDVVIMTGQNEDRVRALIKLNDFSDHYLFVGRMVDPKVLSHLLSTQKATQDYLALQQKYSKLQVSVTLIFAIVGFVLLIIAIWFGLLLTRQLVNPINTLIKATDSVSAGDLSVRVPENVSGLQEFEYLAHAFNRMTIQIEEQKNELIEANRLVDRRRHFTETVLAGVSSGVIATDNKGQITVANSAAYELLKLESDILTGTTLEKILPEIAPLLKTCHEGKDRRGPKIVQSEILITQPDHSKRMFLVRIAVEMIEEKEMGAILTFDDITDLQAAQRKAAWSDVARRIAHEIKNPLTPIQLSAERLKRRYLKQIKEDPETFIQCTDTIIRHVADIGHMVNEFSSFARMPEPVLTLEDMSKQIEKSLSLHRSAHPELKIKWIEEGPQALYAYIDSQQIRQVLTNLIQNAADSIAESTKPSPNGCIDIALGLFSPKELFIAISDNGQGFPANEDRSSLTEPYVTHKQKGTGLGLAIVKKIISDHNGTMLLGEPEWLAEKEILPVYEEGACVVLTLPLESTEKTTKINRA